MLLLDLFIFKEGFNYLYEIPHNKGISTADFWNKGVDWVWDTFFQTLKIFNTWLITEVLQPMRALYLSVCLAVATFSISHWSWLYNRWNTFSFCSGWINIVYSAKSMVG